MPCIKYLFIDLDGTIWDCLDISSLEPPFRRVSKDRVVDRYGREVRLFEDVELFLSEIRKSGVKVIALSWNIFEKAYQALQAFDLLKHFDDLVIENHPHKGIAMKRYFERRGIAVDPKEVLYIDDRDIHLQEVRKLVGDVVFLKAWNDFSSYRELLEMVKNMVCRER